MRFTYKSFNFRDSLCLFQREYFGLVNFFINLDDFPMVLDKISENKNDQYKLKAFNN